jgi:hypothetical protein
MTNEERFIASCESVGEADVRQKLNANRFSSQKALWAGDWLELSDSAKSDVTKAEERSSGLRMAARNDRHYALGVSALFLVLLLASGALILMR